MRYAAALVLLCAAAPAAAQLSTSNVPSAADVRTFEAGQREAPFFRDNYVYASEAVFEANLRRAGAWGECVANAAPEESRAYLASSRITQSLRWNFQRCQRKVGQFDGAGVGAVRRAALIDALRAG